MKRVFLSATYEDQTDLIEEIKSKMAELGVKVIHFKEPDFYDGRAGIHSHDICIEKVKITPNYILIVNSRAGSDYEGNNSDYRGLSLTHAEFRSAWESTNKNKKMYCFVRKKVMDFYDWKQQRYQGLRVFRSALKVLRKLLRRENNASWLVETKVFELLEDLKTRGVWIDFFHDSIELKQFLSAKEFTAD